MEKRVDYRFTPVEAEEKSFEVFELASDIPTSVNKIAGNGFIEFSKVISCFPERAKRFIDTQKYAQSKTKRTGIIKDDPLFSKELNRDDTGEHIIERINIIKKLRGEFDFSFSSMDIPFIKEFLETTQTPNFPSMEFFKERINKLLSIGKFSNPEEIVFVTEKILEVMKVTADELILLKQNMEALANKNKPTEEGGL